MQPHEVTPGEKAAGIFFVCLVFVIIFGAAFLARSNVKRGRVDRRGAFRLAFFVFCASMALWLCRSHIGFAAGIFGSFITATSTALFMAGTIWVLYLAVEPYVRRNWHQALISWTRLSSGQWRDPLVGRDVLFGIVLGIVWSLIYEVRFLVAERLGLAPALMGTEYLLGARAALSAWVAQIPNSVQATLIFFFMIFLLRVVFRKQWLAAAIFTLIFTLLKLAGSNNPMVDVPAQLTIYAIAAVVVVRFGLIALSAGIFTANILLNIPVTTNVAEWYAASAAVALLGILALAVWAFHTSLAGRTLFNRDLFE